MLSLHIQLSRAAQHKLIDQADHFFLLNLVISLLGRWNLLVIFYSFLRRRSFCLHRCSWGVQMRSFVNWIITSLQAEVCHWIRLIASLKAIACHPIAHSMIHWIGTWRWDELLLHILDINLGRAIRRSKLLHAVAWVRLLAVINRAADSISHACLWYGHGLNRLEHVLAAAHHEVIHCYSLTRW